MKFEEQYGYKSFIDYKKYFQPVSDRFNNRSPFEIDMDSINSELKDFFYNTDIDLIFKNKKNTVNLSIQIIEILQLNPTSSREIENKLSLTTEETIFALQQLLEKNKIAINTQNKFYLI